MNHYTSVVICGAWLLHGLVACGLLACVEVSPPMTVADFAIDGPSVSAGDASAESVADVVALPDGPVAVDALPDGPPAVDALPDAPPMVDASRDGPSIVDALPDDLPMVDASRDGPSIVDALSDGPSIVDALSDGPSIVDALPDAPPMVDASRDGPSIVDALPDDLPAVDASSDAPLDADLCQACTLPNAQARCVNGDCTIERCDEDWHDIDHESVNGCEYFCEYDPRGRTEYVDARDNNCDGRVDEVGVYRIYAGADYNCAVLSAPGMGGAGRVKCWGNKESGQLGMNQDQDSAGDSPFAPGNRIVEFARPALAVSLSSCSCCTHVCAASSNREAKCWGFNGSGQLGLGDTEDRGCDMEPRCGVYEDLPAVDLGSDMPVISVATGADHSCAVFEDGQLKCWGSNARGQLGLQLQTNRGDAPDQPGHEMGEELPFVGLGPGRRVLSVVAGFFFTCALTSGGQVMCWGQSGAHLGILGWSGPIVPLHRPSLFWGIRIHKSCPSSRVATMYARCSLMVM